MAAGRVWRVKDRRSGGKGEDFPARVRRPRSRYLDAAFDASRTEKGLDDSRIGTGREFLRAGRTPAMGRVGRFRCLAGKIGFLSARTSGALRQIRIQSRAVWPFRPRLRP